MAPLLLLMLLLAALFAQQGSAAGPTSLVQQSASGEASLDYEFFKTRVQPIFLTKRPGRIACIKCHEEGSGGLRLQELSPGATTWNEEQSRKNFESIVQKVVPGNLMASPLLVHPLATEAGGDAFHSGGKHFDSQDDPEWQTLAAWVRTGRAATSTAARSLDFNFYRTRVEPLFLKSRVGQGSGRACFTCHTTVASRLRLAPLAPGVTSWTEEQSRSNFELAAQLVTPGDPLSSRLLLHPLAPEAGGDPQHTGGKFWKSQDDPDWQTLAAWVRTGKAAPGRTPTASSGSTASALDFDYFRMHVEPIFLNKRPGNTRCYVCHSEGSGGFRLERLSENGSWTSEQSRKNFEAASQRVLPGNPAASRLLMHPLAAEAGGDPYHGGGKHWKEQNDPEWQALAAWVKGQRCISGGGSAASIIC